MDINKIAKEMTREEFLESDYILNKDNEDDFISYKCPYELEINNIEKSECEKNTPFSCEKCWENAIKDIKFKGEDCMEFDWDEFKKGKIIVHCQTEKEAADFLNKCNLNNIKWADGSTTNKIQGYNNSCYRFIDYGLGFGESEYYGNHEQYKIIEWEIENKMDYDREYNIVEIMEFPEEIKIKNQYNMFYKISKSDLYYTEDENRWVKSNSSLRSILNMKFKLVKEDKKVSFEEAIKSYGKEIYCIWKDDDGIEHKSEYCIRHEWDSCITDQNCEDLTPYEMVRGEWHIKED